jgi:hypothetical protein
MGNDFRIHKLLYSEISSIYPELFDKIFKEDCRQIPSYVYIGFLQERYVGIMSVYLHNTDSVYVQYAGYDGDIGKHYRPILFKEVIAFIHKDYKNIIFRIENTNIPALKIALNTGFRIIGIRLDGVLYVELLKTKEVN